MISHDAFARAHLGRRVYGVGAIALGGVGLVWGDFAAVWQPVPASTPHRKALAYIIAVCLLSAGAAIPWRRLAQTGLLILSIFYFIFALLCCLEWLGIRGSLPHGVGFSNNSPW